MPPITAPFYTAAPVVLIAPVGDSIMAGVNTTTASFRTGLYFRAAAAGTPIHFVGANTFAGTDNSMVVNPDHYGFSGWHVRSGVAASLIDRVFLNDGIPPPLPITLMHPDVVLLQGGTNDIGVLLDDATTVRASLASQRAYAWSTRTTDHLQIVQLAILPRLDSVPFNNEVIAVNAALASDMAGESFKANTWLIDISNALANPTVYDATTNPTGGYNDPVHPNAIGDDQIAAKIWASMAPILAAAH